MPWVGRYKIIDTNQDVIKISDGKNSDWIHRNPVFKLIERKLNLRDPKGEETPPPTALDSGAFNQPGKSSVTSVGQNSGGLGVKSSDKPKRPRGRPRKGTKPEPVSPTIPVETRRSTRSREPIQRIQLDHKKKQTYAQAVLSKPTVRFSVPTSGTNPAY